MKRTALSFLAIALVAAMIPGLRAGADSPPPPILSATLSQSCSGSSPGCAPGTALVVSVPYATTVTVYVLANMSGTGRFEQAADCATYSAVSLTPIPSGSSASSFTASGAWSGAVNAGCLRIRLSAITSGYAQVLVPNHILGAIPVTLASSPPLAVTGTFPTPIPWTTGSPAPVNCVSGCPTPIPWTTASPAPVKIISGAPTPIPWPSSSPGNAQLVVPANASAAPYTPSNPMPVTTPAPQASITVNQGTSPFIMANQQADSSPTGTLTTNGDAVTVSNLGGIRSIGLTLTGTHTGTISVQGNVDGASWANIQGYQTSALALAGPTTTANVTNWVFPVGGLKQFRVTATSAMTGTTNVFLYASNSVPMGAGGMNVAAIIQNSVGSAAAVGSFPGADNYTPNENSLLVTATNYTFDGTFMQRVMGCPNTATVNISTATTTSIVAVSGSTAIYVCSYSLYVVSGTLPSFQFEYGTGAACVTTQTVIGGTFGGVAGAVGELFPSPPENRIGYVFKTPASKALCLVSGGTSPNIQGYVTWGQY